MAAKRQSLTRMHLRWLSKRAPCAFSTKVCDVAAKGVARFLNAARSLDGSFPASKGPPGMVSTI